jgi:undecaprenyl diphosphate synthase
VTLVDVSRLPDHVAIVMDGNGRWAEERGCLRTDGHEEGSKAVRRIVRHARRLGIRGLTLYAFSEQNWSRPPAEVAALMELLREFLLSERQEMLENGIRLHPVGRLDKLPDRVREVLIPLRDESADRNGMVLTLCLSYGGREEIADAAQLLARRAAAGELDPETIDVDTLTAMMPSLHVGPVDLLIRTGGEQRLSNFLLWGSAYAELFFTPKLWPEYGAEDLCQAIAAYQARDRRFGGVRSGADACSSTAPASRAHL